MESARVGFSQDLCGDLQGSFVKTESFSSCNEIQRIIIMQDGLY